MGEGSGGGEKCQKMALVMKCNENDNMPYCGEGTLEGI